MNTLNTISDRGLSPPPIPSYPLIALTLLAGWASLILIMVFIYWGPLGLVKLGLDETSALLINAFLSLSFFVQHSGMIRRSFRRWSGRFIDEKYLGALYTITSSASLLLVVVFWQQSTFVVVSAQGGLRWLLRGVFYLSLFGIGWGLWSLGKFDAFGLDPIRTAARVSEAAPIQLLVRGPYRWVRHPLYFFCLLLIWSYPNLTADRLVFNVLWTVWIVIGTVLEERDLVEVFGQEYRNYQRQVPMLLPNSFRPIYWVPQAALPREAKQGVEIEKGATVCRSSR